MTEEEFVNEIQELKKQMLQLAERWSNITKFEIEIDYSWENRNRIIDWKKDKDDTSIEKYTENAEADFSILDKEGVK